MLDVLFFFIKGWKCQVLNIPFVKKLFLGVEIVIMGKLGTEHEKIFVFQCKSTGIRVGFLLGADSI